MNSNTCSNLRTGTMVLGTLALLLLGGCKMDCDAGCIFGRTCPDGSCANCCDDSDCDLNTHCDEGMCVDICETSRCRIDCSPFDPLCDPYRGCCLGDPGCGCCEDADCPEGQRCADNLGSKLCLPACQDLGQDCDAEQNPCCDGLTCHHTDARCAPACQVDADCQALDDPFAQDQTCDEQACTFFACESENECVDQQQCFEGLCLNPPECDWIQRCSVTPAGLELAPGESAQLSAGAFLIDGTRTPVQGFTWTPHPPGIIEVDDQGVVSASTYAGTATIRATVVGCDTYCQVEVTALGE